MWGLKHHSFLYFLHKLITLSFKFSKASKPLVNRLPSHSQHFFFKAPDPGTYFYSVLNNSYYSVRKGKKRRGDCASQKRVSVPSPGLLWPCQAAVAGLARSQRGEELLSAGLPCWRDSERCHGSDRAERYIVPHSAHHVPHLLGEGNGYG